MLTINHIHEANMDQNTRHSFHDEHLMTISFRNANGNRISDLVGSRLIAAVSSIESIE